MGELLCKPVWYVTTSTGAPGAGYLLYSYEVGTTTPKALYQDLACTVPHTNPVVFDTRGEAEIYVDGAYKLVLKTAAGVEVWTVLETTNIATGLQAGTVAFSALDVNGNADISGTLNIGSGTTRKVAPAGTFVNNSSGYPIAGSSGYYLTVEDIPQSTWESVGPTGSGADNIWDALDSVPADANWIVVRAYTYAHSTGDTADAWRELQVYVRKNGSLVSAGTTSQVVYNTSYTTDTGNGAAGARTEFHIPVSTSIMFDVYWLATYNATKTVRFYLVGWGFNP